MSKSVYARVVHDLKLFNDSFNFPLGLIKYIVIIVVTIKYILRLRFYVETPLWPHPLPFKDDLLHLTVASTL